MARPKELLVDKRIVERNIEKGLISEADYGKHLEALADSESNLELIVVEPPSDAEASEEA